MADHFSKKTFAYFEQAKRNRKNKNWFEKNRAQYDEFVREPFAHLIAKIAREFASELPRVHFDPKKISQPCYRANRVPEDGSVIKLQASTHFAEKATSMFETNPGIYISIGQDPDSCLIGVGLYMPSGRQTSLLRNSIAEDFEALDSILSARKLRSVWGGLGGDVYKRFPKGYDASSPAAKYLVHRQFFLSQDLSRTEICSKKFAARICRDIGVVLPFLKWSREVVGTYRGKGMIGSSRASEEYR